MTKGVVTAILDAVDPRFYAPVMGIAGLGISWRTASSLLGVPAIIGEVAIGLSFVLFGVISFIYITKVILRPQCVIDLWSSNIAMLFAPLFPTSVLLLSIGARPYDTEIATLLWMIASPISMILTIVIVGRWLLDARDNKGISPAWMFPVVGNGFVTIAGVPLGFVEIGWAYFAIAFVLWILAFAVVFGHFVHGGALAKPARPTMLVLIAPPATFFIAYVELTGSFNDLFAHSMIYSSVFLFAVFLSNWKWMFDAPFSIASWSLTFPMATLTVATLTFFQATSWATARWAATGFLGLASFFTVSVAILGVIAILRNLRSPAVT